MKKWKIMPLIVLVILLMTGCQETPEKSAVVDKSVGLDEELILKPLKRGKTGKRIFRNSGMHRKKKRWKSKNFCRSESGADKSWKSSGN